MVHFLKRAGILAPALVVLAAMPATADEPPRRGGPLIYAVGAEPPNYDCHANSSFAASHVLMPHYSTLIRIDAANYPEIAPDLAESWTVSPDRLTYSFRLRPGVKFHDGSILTSEDIRATYDRLRHPPAGVVSLREAAFEDIASIETPDPLTVVFALSQPNSSMLTNLALPWNCVYSAARLKEDPNWPATHVMGTGPFRFVAHVAGSHWEGARFADYYRPGRPYLDGFRAQFINGAPMVNALQAGSVLAEFRGVTPGEQNRLREALGDKIAFLESPWLCTIGLFFNTTKKPFDDARVRRALSLAIDRWHGAEALSKIAIVRDVGATLRPGYKLAASDAELEQWPGFGRDIAAARAEARRLLKEAGVTDLHVKLLNRNVPMPFIPVGIFLVDQWRQIGVTAEHQPLDVRTQKASFSGFTFEAGLDGLCEDIDDPNLQLLGYISTDRSPRSRSGVVDRALDDLYDRQKAAETDDERRVALRAFDERVLTEAYAVPVVWWHRIVAMWSKVRGWRVTPSAHVGQDLADLWLAE